MTAEDAVCEILRGLTGVTDRVSTRIFQLVIRQNAPMPAVRVQLIDDPMDYHLRGGSGFGIARVQVDAVGSNYETTSALAEAIEGDEAGGGLSGFRGTVGGSPALLQITGIRRVSKGTDYFADELRQVRIRQDYEVHWRRAA